MITVVGMGLVFAALALLWGLTRLLTKVFADKEEPAAELNMVLEEADVAEAQAALEAAAELTEERARVAAMVAGALLATRSRSSSRRRPAARHSSTAASRPPG